MTLQLALADGRRANIQFQGTMDEAYKAYDGAPLTVLGQWQDWYSVRFDGMVGWASSDFITLV